jgi:hypothetical protein
MEQPQDPVENKAVSFSLGSTRTSADQKPLGSFLSAKNRPQSQSYGEKSTSCGAFPCLPCPQ